MSNGRTAWSAAWILVGILACGPAVGQAPEGEAVPAATPVNVTADKMDYDRDRGIVEATGNAIVRRGTEELRANWIHVDLNTSDAHASGNVEFSRDGVMTWKGETLSYNFKTRELQTDSFAADMEPFHVWAESSEKSAADEYILQRATVTTCDPEQRPRPFQVKAKRITVVPDQKLVAHHAVMYLGGVPMFYTPYWYRPLDRETGLRIKPGYRSSMGGFVLVSYGWPLNDYLTSVTHVDFRSRRGWAYGQDLEWDDPARQWDGYVQSYYLDDDEPWEDDEDPDTSLVDHERYRFRMYHHQYFGPRNSVTAKGEYLSDPRIVQTFFRSDYRLQRYPENYVRFAHRGRNYLASLLLKSRFNDFFSSVNRLPRLGLDFSRQEVPGTSLYIESRNAAEWLEKVYAEDSSHEDYSVFRVDSDSKLYYPTRPFGFLNVIPRVGYRGTYYSDTLTQSSALQVESNTVTQTVVENGQTSTVDTVTFSTNTVTQYADGGSSLRSVYELGTEISFKAFRAWETEEGRRYINGWRHIVEPYVNYTYVPEPNLLPSELYQFDSVDELEKRHFVRFGARNKLQTRRNLNPYDLIDLNVYSYYLIHRDPGERVIQSIFWDSEFAFFDWISLESEGRYRIEEAYLTDLETRLELQDKHYWELEFEHRYRYEDSDLWSGEITFKPTDRWRMTAYGRYEVEEDRLEEERFSVAYDWGCLAASLFFSFHPSYTTASGRDVDEEFQVTLLLWLTDFPGSGLQLSAED